MLMSQRDSKPIYTAQTLSEGSAPYIVLIRHVP